MKHCLTFLGLAGILSAALIANEELPKEAKIDAVLWTKYETNNGSYFMLGSGILSFRNSSLHPDYHLNTDCPKPYQPSTERFQVDEVLMCRVVDKNFEVSRKKIKSLTKTTSYEITVKTNIVWTESED